MRTAGRRNQDITFTGNDASDTQASPTQRYGFAVQAPRNGSTLSQVDLVNNTGRGNTKGLYSLDPIEGLTRR
jgi:hypothetical protein